MGDKLLFSFRSRLRTFFFFYQMKFNKFGSKKKTRKKFSGINLFEKKSERFEA